MSDYSISSTGHDDNGRYYELEEDAPFDSITVDEADGTVTFHGRPALMRLVRELLALERDRLLGFPEDELHRPPRDVIEDTLGVLTTRGWDPDEVVLPDDQTNLGLDLNVDT